MLGSDWIKSLLRSTTPATPLSRKVSRSRARLDGNYNRQLLRRILLEGLEQRQLLAADVMAIDSNAGEVVTGSGTPPQNGQFEITGDPGEIVTFTLGSTGQDNPAGTSPSSPEDATASSGAQSFAIDAGIGSTLHTVTLGLGDGSPGSGTALIDIEVIDDDVWDGPADEEVTIELQSGSSGPLGASTSAVVTIADNEAAPEISIAATDASADPEDGADVGVFTISVIGPASDSDITFTTAYTGTADGSDFTASTGPTTIAAGDSSVTISVAATDDTLVEADETVVGTITSTTTDVDVATGGASDTVTIIDDDAATVKIEATGGVASEPNSSSVPGFRLSLDGDTVTGPVVVSYSVGNATGSTAATLGVDFDFTDETDPFAGGAGISTAQGLTGFISDALTVGLNGSGSPGGFYAFYAGGAGSTTISIDDVTVEFTIYDAGGSALGTSSGQTLTIPVAAGVHYLELHDISGPGSLTSTALVTAVLNVPSSDGFAVIVDGSVVPAHLNVDVIDDSVVEGTENVEVTIDSVIVAIGDVTPDAMDTADRDISDDDVGEVSIAAGDDGSEPATDGSFVVTITENEHSTVLVPYTVGGTASNVIDANNPDSPDHSLMDGTLTFTAGQTTADLIVPVIDSSLIEKDETVEITLGTPVTPPSTPVYSVVTATATIDILDEDDGEAQINASFNVVTEGGFDGEFTVFLTEEDGTTPVTADSETEVIIVFSGTADPGAVVDTDDYHAVDGTSETHPYTVTVTIDPHENSTTISIDVTDDMDVEVDETVIATITALGTSTTDANIEIGDTDTDTVTIQDNETLKVAIAAGVDGDEYDGPSNDTPALPSTPGTFTFTVADGVSTSDVIVEYSVVTGVGGSTAIEGTDFTDSLSGTVTIPSGSPSTTISIDVIDDSLLETTETVVLKIDSVSTTGSVMIDGSSDEATINILDDDVANAEITGVDDAREPAEDGSFVVTLLGTSPSPVIVTFAVDDSLATDAEFGVDYDIPDSAFLTVDASGVGTMTFQPNQMTASIPIEVINDGDVEGIEDVRIDLLSAIGSTVYSITGPTATVNILEDQVVEIVASSNGAEGGSDPTFTIEMSAVSDTDTEVEYDFVGGTADSSDHSVTLKGTATITAGATQAVVTVPVVDDGTLEVTEDIEIQLTAIVAGDADIQLFDDDPNALENNTTVEIVDNDAAYVTIVATDPKGFDNPSSTDDGEFTVYLSAPSSEYTVVLLEVGTETTAATPDDDYTELGSGGFLTITFDPGETSKPIDVEVINDPELEADETVTLTLLSVSSQDSMGAPVSLPIFLGAIGGPTLTFQNTPGGYAGTQDTQLDQTDGFLNFGSFTTYEVDIDSIFGPSTDQDQILIEFEDIFGAGLIPIGSVISTATLDFFEFNSGTPVAVHELLNPWVESVVTWDNANFAGNTDPGIQVDDVEAAIIPVSIGSTTNGVFDVTSSITAWALAPGDNHGWVLLATGTDDEQYRSSESSAITTRPELTVELDLSATVTICDTDVADVQIISTSDAAEPGTDGYAVVQLSAPSAVDVEVTYMVEATSTAFGGGVDYTDVEAGIVTIGMGSTSATIPIMVNDDSLLEVTETVDLKLTGASGPVSVGASDTGTVNILDDDSVIGATVTVTAGSTAGSDSIATEEPTDDGVFTFAISTASTTPTEVVITTSGDTDSNDHPALPATVTIPAFTLSTSVVVDVTDDGENEPDEDVTVTIDSVSSSFASVTGSGSATVTIEDNDDLIVDIEATDATATEGSSDNGLIVISLDNPSSVNTIVEFSVGGSADPTPPVGGSTGTDDDYDKLSDTNASGTYGTVTITAGATSATFDVNALSDFVLDDGEEVIVTIEDVTNTNGLDDVTEAGVSSSVGTASATVTINDETFVIRVIDNDNPAEEDGPLGGGDNGQFTIYMDNPIPAGQNVEVEYTIVLSGSNPATPDVDYEIDGYNTTTSIGTATILGGNTSVVLDVDVLFDEIVEPTETVDILLTGVAVSGAAVGPALSMTASEFTAQEEILDNDSADITVTAGPDATEGSSDTYFVFSQSNPGSVETVLSYVLDGSATQGADATSTDYDASVFTGTVTIPAATGSGPVTVSVPVDVFDDNIVESLETVIVKSLTKVSGPGAASVTVDTATANIIDDDFGTATVEILPADTIGSEPGTNDASFVVVLSNPSSSETVVEYSLSGDAIGGGDDYNDVLTGTVTVPIGATSATVPIDVVDDSPAVIEDDETVTATLSGVSAGYSTTGGPADVTIEDDDTGLVSVEGTMDGDENLAGTAIDGFFTITLDTLSDEDTEITYTIGGASSPAATDSGVDADHTSGTTGTVTIDANTTQITVPIVVVDDSTVEADENVRLTLNSVVAGNTGSISIDGSASNDEIQILDDDTPTFTVTDAMADEGDSMTFYVELSNPISTDTIVTVSFGAMGDTADSSDYDDTSVDVTFTAGDTASKPVVVATTPDDVVEADETFTVSLSTAAVGAIATDTGNGTIKNDETAVFTIEDFSLDPGTEGSGGAAGPHDYMAMSPYTELSFTIDVDHEIDVDTVVLVHFADGTATGSDFVAEWGTAMAPASPTGDYDNAVQTLTLTAGQQSLDVTVLVNPDDLVEGGLVDTMWGEESFTVSLSDSSGTRATDTTDGAEGTIEDDDEAEVWISATDMEAEEPGNDGEFTIYQGLASSSDTVVTYTVTGTADEGVDFEALTGTATITAGQTSTTILIDVINNAILEDDETVVITLDSISSSDPDITLATGMGPLMDTVTIEDDDNATVKIEATDPDASENPLDHGQFTLTLSEIADTDTIVLLSVATGTGEATPGSDYDAIDTTVTIPANQTQTTVDVNVIDDSDDDDGETVTVSIIGFQSPTNADITIDTMDTDTVTIDGADGDILVGIEACGDGMEEGEADGCFYVTLRDSAGNLVPAPTGGVLVGFKAPTGTASEGLAGDYSIEDDAFIPSGDVSKLVTVDVEDDSDAEGDETIIMEIDSIINSPSYGGSPPAGTSGNIVVDPGTAQILILDDDVAAPQVASTELMDNSGDTTQRSNIKKIRVTFDTLVAFTTDAFTLEKRSDTTVGDIDGTIDSSTGLIVTDVTGAGSVTVVELTLDTGAGNALIDSLTSSLVNGNYQVVVDASKVASSIAMMSLLDGNGDGTGGDNYVFGDQLADNFFRLFGDADGDGDFDTDDVNDFLLPALFGPYEEEFDGDGDGDVDTNDINDSVLPGLFGDNQRDLGGF